MRRAPETHYNGPQPTLLLIGLISAYAGIGFAFLSVWGTR